MKKIKMFAVLLTTVMGLTMIPDANAVTAKAAEPITYSVKYIMDGDNGEWFYQAETNNYDENASGAEWIFLLDHLKDGDVVVVYNDSEDAPLLDLGNIRLSNLTIVAHKFSMVKVGSIENFYANSGSNSSITATITNANVYFDALCNFNNDVKILNAYYEKNDEDNAPTIGCAQKVEQLNLRSSKESNEIYDSLYNFESGSLYIVKGKLQTEESKYSHEPVATSTTTTASNSSEYDKVPKTGQNNSYLWLLGIAMACFVGSGLVKKTTR